MKKICVILIFGLLVFPLFLNFATAEENYLDNSIFGVSAEGVTLNEGWKTWGVDLKDKILENSVVSAVDSFLQNISFVFQIIFGTPYSLSLALLWTIIFWLYALSIINTALKMSLFSKGISTLISIGVVILMAQFGFFKMIVNLLIQLLFGENPWYVKVGLGLLILVGLVFVFLFLKQFAKQTAESKKKKKDEENRLKLETSAKVGEEFSKAITEGE